MITLTAITGFSLLGILAAKPPMDEKPKYKNQQVLSQKISDEDMDYVLESFSVNLGANCLFCHPGKQNGSEGIVLSTIKNIAVLAAVGLVLETPIPVYIDPLPKFSLMAEGPIRVQGPV